MSKKVYEGLMTSMRQAIAYAKGDPSGIRRVVHVAIKPADIKTARQKVGMSRDAFARVFGLSAATLRKWENGERKPTGAARALLAIISREPEAVLRAIRN